MHGFTGSPASVRGIAERCIAEGYDVEMPRLPGHATTIDDMMNTGWADWLAATEDAWQRLADRVERVFVVGLSMGGTLALAAALAHRETAGLVCINPATQPQPAEVIEALDDMLADGVTVLEGDGSDIADPEAKDLAYDDTPIGPLRSLLVDGLAPLTDRFGELQMPLRLLTSRQDHVVLPADSEHLVATYGGPVSHTWLERSFHVATRDYDRALIESACAAFISQEVQ